MDCENDGCEFYEEEEVAEENQEELNNENRSGGT